MLQMQQGRTLSQVQLKHEIPDWALPKVQREGHWKSDCRLALWSGLSESSKAVLWIRFGAP